MAKLNPPLVDEKMPAQWGESLTFPFLLSRFVGKKDLETSKIFIKIKTMSTNTIKFSQEANIENSTKGYEYYEATCKIPNDLFSIGQVYKVQLAFVNNGEQGDFSDVSVFKYTSKPQIQILDALGNPINQNSPVDAFIGMYHNDDFTEKVCNYKFEVFENDKLLVSTGDLIHNALNDDYSIESKDKYILKKDFQMGKEYSIKYSVKTNNDLYLSTEYPLGPKPKFSVPFPGELYIYADNMMDESYISLVLQFTEEATIQGTYQLIRADDTTNFQQWDILHTLEYYNKTVAPNETLPFFKDFTIKQGVSYQYALQRIWDGGKYKSKKRLALGVFDGMKMHKTSTVKADFENMTLADNEVQLKIKFNPKISSFKNDILESKVDTIGSKYPFFFRNGTVNYKQFSISGLISALSDTQGLFMQGIDKDNLSTSLTGEMTTLEREFRLKALEWLTNGKPKLFRSATEGNYIVRLTQVSLTPLTQLGRMIYTFQATAYEIEECSLDHLLSNKLTTQDLIIDHSLESKNIEFLKDEENPFEAPFENYIIDYEHNYNEQEAFLELIPSEKNPTSYGLLEDEEKIIITLDTVGCFYRFFAHGYIDKPSYFLTLTARYKYIEPPVIQQTISFLNQKVVKATITNAPIDSKWRIIYKGLGTSKNKELYITIGATGTYLIPILEQQPLVSVTNLDWCWGTRLEYFYETENPNIDSDMKTYEMVFHQDQFVGPSKNIFDIVKKRTNCKSVELTSKIIISEKLLHKVYKSPEGKYYLDKWFDNIMDYWLYTTLYYYLDDNNNIHYIMRKLDEESQQDLIIELTPEEIKHMKEYTIEQRTVKSTNVLESGYIEIQPTNVDGEDFLPTLIGCGAGLNVEVAYYTSSEKEVAKE